MGKRNLGNEIKALKDRAEFNTRHEMFFRLNQLQEFTSSLNNDTLKDLEFLKLVPVRLVAIMESYFRSVIKSLIDHGEPFLKNVPKLNQPNDGKISIDLLLSLNASEFTIGELIAHVLPCNKFSEIETTLDILTEKGISKELKEFLPNTIYDHNKTISEIYISLEPLIKKDIIEVFRLRNIFCHELGATENVSQERMKLLVVSVSLFINHLDNYIENLMYPNAPETTADINNALGWDLEQVNIKLRETIDEIKTACEHENSPTFNFEIFNSVQEHWHKYIEESSRMSAHSCEGGTMYPQLFYSTMIHLTEERIKQLKIQFKSELENYKKRSEGI